MPDFSKVAADAATATSTFLNLGKKDAEIVYTQDTSSIQEYAKAQKKETFHGQMIGNTQKQMEKVAEIPVTVYYHLLSTYGHPRDNPKAWRKWLNEHSDFKTSVREL